MPIGQHLTRCLHCGCDFTCGDSILTTCDKCRQAGHTGSWSIGCPQCEGERLDRIIKLMNKADELIIKYQSVHRDKLD